MQKRSTYFAAKAQPPVGIEEGGAEYLNSGGCGGIGG